jgi:hypothetical protein
MDSGKLNDWLQVVGMFGVIASLIFVGLQMKQSHEIALSSAYAARAQISVDYNLASSGNPEFTSATAKIYRGEVDSITLEERVALEYNFGANMYMWENQYFQFKSGFLPEEKWLQILAEMHCMFSNSLYRGLLFGWYFPEPFQKILDEIVDGAEKNPSDCWEVDYSTDGTNR